MVVYSFAFLSGTEAGFYHWDIANWKYLYRGVINTWGAFQTYYEQVLLTDMSASSIAWIGSLQSFLLMLFGVVTGPLFDAGYLRELLGFGTFLLSFGLMMT